MYTLFRNKPARSTGTYVFNELVWIRRKYAEMLDDVKQFYARAPKQVDARNVLGNLLQHIPVRMDLEDHDYIRYAADWVDNLSRAFGFVTSSNRGRVHAGGVTLGGQTEEIIIATNELPDIKDAGQRWRRFAPFTYLYHTRTDTNLPIMNNSAQGPGYGIAALNIPLLALQYRYWVRMQAMIGLAQKDSVYRFIGGYVLPNATDSFLDIAFFNRIANQAQGIPGTNLPNAHAFYLSDISNRLEQVGKLINNQALRMDNIENMAWVTPMLSKANLFEVMALPKDPVTRHNEWAYAIARMSYIKYLVGQGIAGMGMERSQTNDVMISILEARRDNIFSSFASTAVVKTFMLQADEVLELLKK